jgi:hypothetical protein
MRLTPSDGPALARAVAEALVVDADDGARQSGLSYWQRSRAWTAAVATEVDRLHPGPLRDACQRLHANPTDAEAFWQVCDSFGETPPASTDPAAKLAEAAWRAMLNCRIGFHLGIHYRADASAPATDELHLAAVHGAGARSTDAPVLIVVPFRDNGTDGHRLRNLMACLAALRDQDCPGDQYQVTVVEEDREPRWQAMIEPACDQYVFAYREGSFNKSWAVNVGVRQAGAAPELVCILDADVLCDRAFVSRNARRLQRSGTGGHLTYRDMFCLDPAASRRAIAARVVERTAAVSWGELRGFLLRRPPGACVWLRTEVFWSIGGMDERYEGWGGEDNDFVFRLDLAAPLDIYGDELLHLYHYPSSQLIDGRGLNDHIPPLSWPADSRIGNVSRYRAAAGGG